MQVSVWPVILNKNPVFVNSGTNMVLPGAYARPRLNYTQMARHAMKLISDIFERLPQVWVLLGLLFASGGLYLGFDYSLAFVYFTVGAICFLYGVLLFVFMQREGAGKANARPLSKDFISIGATVVMPAQQADQETTAN